MYENEYDAYLDGRSEMLRDVIEYMKVHMFDNKYWVSKDGKEEFQPFDFICILGFFSFGYLCIFIR